MRALLTRLRGIKRLSPVLAYINDTSIAVGRYIGTEKGLYKILSLIDGNIYKGSYIYSITETELLNLIKEKNRINEVNFIQEQQAESK